MLQKTLLRLLLLIGIFSIYSSQNCPEFTKLLKQAERIYDLEFQRDELLQEKGFIMTPADVGFERDRQNVCNASNYWPSGAGKSANILTTAAKLVSDSDLKNLASFDDNSACYKPTLIVKSHPKYRPINGYGNNLKNPRWGTPRTPYGRLVPKNYDDGVHSIRKSVTGNELPNPRKLFLDVLFKAKKYPRTSNDPNETLLLFVLMLTHDMASQIPVEAFDNCQEIRCCKSGNKGVLSPTLQNSACFPIRIPDDDPFYKDSNVKCLNMVRAEIASTAGTVQYGEILNKVTGYMDLSVIYGSENEELKKVRTFTDGKLNLGAKNLLPSYKNGNYNTDSNRLTSVITSAVFPALFSRNHNSLCDGLKQINPNWSDEKLFQEARRINIAIEQKFVLGGTVVQSVFHKKVNESYSEKFNPSTLLEFTSASYRFLHYFVNTNMKMLTSDNQATFTPISDTFGRIDILENKFDDVVRGLLTQKINFGQYSEEVHGRFAKNKDGIGLDVISFDIQRGRDHGLGTFMETRRFCQLRANFTTIDDLIAIFPQSYVDLLNNAYDSVEDIDLYVGGALESFLTIDEVFVGETLGCIIGEHYRRTMGGDVYFYSSPNSPYPFTPDQLAVIKAYQTNNLFCVNSGITSIAKIWSLLENQTNNPRFPCSNYPQMNLTLWKE